MNNKFDSPEFELAVMKAASKIAQKKLLIAIVSSITISVAAMSIVTKKLLDSMSTKKDWSDVNWGVDGEDNALL